MLKVIFGWNFLVCLSYKVHLRIYKYLFLIFEFALYFLPQVQKSKRCKDEAKQIQMS